MSVQCFCGSWDHEPRHHPDIAAAFAGESRESLIHRIELLTADLDAEQRRPQPDTASRELQEAAQAVVKGWETNGWAADLDGDVAALRAALAATEGEARDE